MIVGIDVSKDKLDIHIKPIEAYFSIKNSQASILHCVLPVNELNGEIMQINLIYIDEYQIY